MCFYFSTNRCFCILYERLCLSSKIKIWYGRWGRAKWNRFDKIEWCTWSCPRIFVQWIPTYFNIPRTFWSNSISIAFLLIVSMSNKSDNNILLHQLIFNHSSLAYYKGLYWNGNLLIFLNLKICFSAKNTPVFNLNKNDLKNELENYGMSVPQDMKRTALIFWVSIYRIREKPTITLTSAEIKRLLACYGHIEEVKSKKDGLKLISEYKSSNKAFVCRKKFEYSNLNNKIWFFDSKFQRKQFFFRIRRVYTTACDYSSVSNASRIIMAS